MTGEYERAARLWATRWATRGGRAVPPRSRGRCSQWPPRSSRRTPNAPEQLLDEAVRTSRAVDGRLLLGLVMSLQATLQRRLGRPLDAVPRLLELIDHWDRLGDLPQLWHAVREAALCLNLLGEDLIAVRLLAAVERIELVMPLLPIDRVYVAETCEQLRDRLGEDEFRRRARPVLRWPGKKRSNWPSERSRRPARRPPIRSERGDARRDVRG